MRKYLCWLNLVTWLHLTWKGHYLAWKTARCHSDIAESLSTLLTRSHFIVNIHWVFNLCPRVFGVTAHLCLFGNYTCSGARAPSGRTPGLGRYLCFYLGSYNEWICFRARYFDLRYIHLLNFVLALTAEQFLQHTLSANFPYFLSFHWN